MKNNLFVTAVGLAIIAAVIGLSVGIVKGSIVTSRKQSGMVHIVDELVYNEKSGVVYIETPNPHGNNYTPYLDEDGYNCYYNRGTDQIERID